MSVASRLDVSATCFWVGTSQPGRTWPRLRCDHDLPESSDTNSDSNVNCPETSGFGWQTPHSSTPSAVVVVLRKESGGHGNLIWRHVDPRSVVSSMSAVVRLDSRTPEPNGAASS